MGEKGGSLRESYGICGVAAPKSRKPSKEDKEKKNTRNSRPLQDFTVNVLMGRGTAHALYLVCKLGAGARSVKRGDQGKQGGDRWRYKQRREERCPTASLNASGWGGGEAEETTPRGARRSLLSKKRTKSPGDRDSLHMRRHRRERGEERSGTSQRN